MNIAIQMDGHETWQLTVTHLVKLFFYDADIVFAPADLSSTAWNIEISIDGEAQRQTVNIQVSDLNNETHNNWCEAVDAIDDGTVKRTVLRGLLELLQDMTGIRQPWGILTGVRPTKLMHSLLRERSSEAAVRELTEQYLLAPDKAQLLAEIVRLQQAVIPDLYDLQDEVSLYIGIPFCPTKCAYCTFPAYDIARYEGAVPQFLEALLAEIRATGEWLRRKGLRVTTIYWGGGTPTSLTAPQMEKLFDELEQSLPAYDQVREVTVEAGRPDTITADKVELMRRRNVHRMSINPQSFTQATLDSIGRHHTVEETINKFLLCRKLGMDNLNMDLIIGLPDEGVGEFTHTIAETEKLLPESLTVHTLSFKRASNMTKRRDQYDVAERDEISEMMLLAEQWTKSHGYRPYYLYRQKNILGNLENVGYAHPGKESLYNILMMEELQTIIGIGCGAVSKIIFSDRIERFANPKEPAQYNESWQECLTRKLRLLDEAYQARGLDMERADSYTFL